jgi:hypothetical protein
MPPEVRVTPPTAPDLLLPAGTRLLHIGPPKTGTTAVQAAFDAGRATLLEQGVRYAGRARHSATAVRAVLGRPSYFGDGEPPPMRTWAPVLREIRSAREPRVVLSSEYFADADPAGIRRVVDQLDGARLHVVITLRPLARILPSQWQQYVRGGFRTSYDAWLDNVLRRPDVRMTPSFWRRHRHDELVARWAAVVGAERMTAIALDERDHDFVLRVFEQLLGLRDGTLRAVPDLANRSLTLPEVEAVRAFNAAFKAEGLPRALHARVMRFGAAQSMKLREPAPDEPRIETPQWALDRATEVAREMVAAIEASGVRVVGDLAPLAEPRRSRLEGDRQPPVLVPPEIAASMAMGILVATGAARGGADRGPKAAEPVELARVPTYQVLGVVALRARHAVTSRVGRLLRLRSRPRRG